MSANKNFLTAADVAEITGASLPTAYRIIRKLNDELEAQGYIVIAGKVSRLYFEKKLYC